MRTFAVLVTLGVIAAPSFALPTGPRNIPALFSKDPMSIHKRSIIPDSIVIVKSAASSLFRPAAEDSLPAEQVFQVEEDEEEDIGDVCSDICGIQRVPGTSDAREALCSVQGLSATLECAQCIDSAFPESSYEDSAVAEYERIVQICEGADPAVVALS